eukprot:evm.model.scf_4.7 EVM.evm.TU.scf_4.7   scf_4:198421-201864(-)
MLTGPLVVNAKELFDIAREEETATTEQDMKDLFSRGADPSACCFIVNRKDGCAVLHATIFSNNSIAASALVEAGAELEATCWGGRTPLHWTTSFNATGIAGILMQAGARLEELFALAKEKESSTTQAAVDELLSAGADPNACCFKLEGSDGCTVLHATTTSDNAVVAAAVTAKGANTEATCNDGQTPLHWAATYNASNVSSALVGAGAKLESRDNDRQTPLHQASKYNAWRVIGVLIGAGADVEAVKEAVVRASACLDAAVIGTYWVARKFTGLQPRVWHLFSAIHPSIHPSIHRP